MKFRKVFLFELAHQLRRRSTWLYFAIAMSFAIALATGPFLRGARSGGYFFNGPFVVAAVSVLSGMAGLLIAAAVAGDAATRDAQARMEPLVFTTPVGKAAYLGGRFAGSFAVSALLLAAVPLGLMIVATLPGLQPEIVGPFRPMVYLGAYALITLPNAFIATALFFAMAALSRRAISSTIGAAALFLGSIVCNEVIAKGLARWTLAKQLDPLGFTIVSAISRAWTPLQKSVTLLPATGATLANRLLWLAFSAGVLALTYARFQFAHRTAYPRRFAFGRRETGSSAAISIVAPEVPRRFDAATRARQLLAVTLRSYATTVTSGATLVLAAIAAVIIWTAPSMMQQVGVPLLPATERMATVISRSGDLFWIIVPFLTVLAAGELVWRERDERMSDLMNAAPLPDWVPFAGKLAGLTLVLATLQALIMATAIGAQLRAGYHDLEPALYLRILGLQLIDYVLFAVLALAVHAVVNQKYVAHAVFAMAVAFTAFAPAIGIEHNLVIYGGDPGLQYSAMRGFDPFLRPFLWFKLYWAGWAFLLAVVASLLWVRGVEQSLGSRLRTARVRLSHTTKWAIAAPITIVTLSGAFIFYNTNVLNPYRTASSVAKQRADVPQPRLAATSFRVELYPERHAAVIDGAYTLVNETNAAIDTIHVSTRAEVRTYGVAFDRPARPAVIDEKLGHRIYELERPLRAGEALRMRFRVEMQPRGFRNSDISTAVVRNGSHIEQEWLPRIGSQSGRERIAFEAIVGTAGKQIALAPGALRRAWSANGRRYFHYVADAPIRNGYAFYSAEYAVYEARWNGVTIQIFHHPAHARNLERIVRSVQAALAYDSSEFGAYPHRVLRLIETPEQGVGLHSDPVNLWYSEGFALLNPDADPRDVDFPFAVVAHAVAHQWWGNQLTPADVEGFPLLTESLAWYSAMGAVERTYGAEHLRHLLDLLREAYLTPRTRAGRPLLQATDRFAAYRKGPFAMYALREYAGEAAVNLALRRLLAKHRAGKPPLPTSLDLYAELRAVSPPSVQPLLADLFAANTYWDLAANRAHAQQLPDGRWRLTLDATAHKAAVDETGKEMPRPMNDLVEIGVFAKDGHPLYLQKQRIHDGAQRITIVVPEEPARAGIDPRNLLIDTAWGDNTIAVTTR